MTGYGCDRGRTLIEGNCLPGRRRIAWVDDVKRWTESGLPAAMRIAINML